MNQISPTPEMGAPPAATLGFLINDVARLLRQRFEAALEAAGLELTAGEARTLAFIATHPGIRQSLLAEHMGVEPMTLVGFLDRLAARDLIVREADPTDRRAKIVVLQPAASAIVRDVQAIGRSVRETATAEVSPEDVETARKVLTAMRAALAE
jgi:DNA-binding MarR family transcriptional regulator